VAHLERTLGVPVVVLRLLGVDGGGGARDGHARYHVEALERPESVRPCDFVVDDHPLRLAWARASGIRELFEWAALHVDAQGPPRQRKTWNLSGLFRLPTGRRSGVAQGHPAVRRRRNRSRSARSLRSIRRWCPPCWPALRVACC
jgi:hypothetical protein